MVNEMLNEFPNPFTSPESYPKCCEVCGAEIYDKTIITTEMAAVVDAKCPYGCPECKAYHFHLRPLRDLVFIWPIPLGPTYLDGGVIQRPPQYIDAEQEMYGRSDYGIILACGPGHHDEDDVFWPTAGLEVGTKVIYDKMVPWFVIENGYNGKPVYTIMCGFADVRGVVIE